MINRLTLSMLLTLASASPTWANADLHLHVDGSAMRAVIQEHDRNLANYQRQVNQIVAGKVREVRVEEEQAAMKSAGHPVALPTGACQAVLTIQPDGTVERAQLAGCASPDLGKAELEAINRAAPFPPLGITANITVQTVAPIATPGVYGN